MHVRYYKEYSQHLQRDMEFKVYGHAGLPMIVFPCQDGKFYDFEDRGMVNTIADRLENGQLQLFCVGCVDAETWSAAWGDQALAEFSGMSSGFVISARNFCRACIRFTAKRTAFPMKAE